MNEHQLAAEIASVQRAGRNLDRALWVITAGAMLFAAVGVTLFANDHGVTLWVAWALDPLTASALFAVLQADAILGRYGIHPGGWVGTLRLGAGAATLAMNIWQPIAGRDPAGVVIHAVPPLLMIGLAEAAPGLRRHFATVVRDLQGQLDRLAAGREASRLAETERAEARRRADAERETAAREAAAAAFRAQRERERGERDKPNETPAPRLPRAVPAEGRIQRSDEVTAKAPERTAEEIIREAYEADLAAGRKIVAAAYDRLAGTNNYARGLIRRWRDDTDAAAAPAGAGA